MSQKDDSVKQLVEADAALVNIARQMAFVEAARVLLTLAHRARQPTLAEAAQIIADLAKDSTKSAD